MDGRPRHRGGCVVHCEQMELNQLVYELQIPQETPSNNAIKGMHFHAYKKLREAFRWQVLRALDGQERHEPLAVARIEVERHCAGGGLDWDNAYGGLKPLMDCLVAPSSRNPDGLGLIEDDNPTCVPEAPRVTQHKAPRGQGRTVLRIYTENKPKRSPKCRSS